MTLLTILWGKDAAVCMFPTWKILQCIVTTRWLCSEIRSGKYLARTTKYFYLKSDSQRLKESNRRAEEWPVRRTHLCGLSQGGTPGSLAGR